MIPSMGKGHLGKERPAISPLMGKTMRDWPFSYSGEAAGLAEGGGQGRRTTITQLSF